jgi:hypothetical protein
MRDYVLQELGFMIETEEKVEVGIWSSVTNLGNWFWGN